MAKPVMILAVSLCGLAAPVQAVDAPAAPLPLLVQTSAVPQPAPQALPLPLLAQAPLASPSPWTGFYVGTDLSVSGGKGIKGGVGGDVFAGYDREFSNNLVLGVQGSAGYVPFGWKYSNVKGYDYAATSVKLGYDMGRLMPYVTAGLGLAKANTGPALTVSPSDSVNQLFQSSGELHAGAAVGAGFDYAVTNNLQVGVGVSVGKAYAPLLP